MGSKSETKSITALLFASLLVLILVLTVSAQPPPPPQGADKTALLDSALTDMKCKVTFETDFMREIIALFPSLSSLLNPKIEALQSDVTRLSQYASRGDVMNYSRYVQEAFTPHLMQAADAERRGLESLREDTSMDKNATKAALRSLKSTFESLQEAQNDCFDAREHANLVIKYYNNSLNMYQARAKNLTDRNIGADSLYNFVSNAKLQILEPLQSGVKSATDSSQIRELLSKYCLYDGCLNGTNYHMAAKYETARLKILLNTVISEIFEISPESVNIDLDKNGYPDRDEIKIKLEHADDEIESWESMDAPEDQLKSTWENIRSAAKGLHALHALYIQLGGAEGSAGEQ